jgi:hypothetical protein
MWFSTMTRQSQETHGLRRLVVYKGAMHTDQSCLFSVTTRGDLRMKVGNDRSHYSFGRLN